MNRLFNWFKSTYWDLKGLEWVTTINGIELTSTLEKRIGSAEDERAKADWVEYWKGDTLVHRSVSIALKQQINLGSEAGNIGV